MNSRLHKIIVEDLINFAENKVVSSALINEFYNIIYNEMEIKENNVETVLFVDSTFPVS